MTNANMDFLVKEYAKMTKRTVGEVIELIQSKDEQVMSNIFKLACICETISKNPNSVKL